MKKKNKDASAEYDGSMSLSGHLRELRNRIAVCVAVLVLGFFGCLSVAGKLVTMLTDMGTAYNYTYVYIAPQELLLVYFNLALIGAVVLTFPVIAYEAYAFCSPGLSRRERTSIALALLAGTLFFAGGVAFARFTTSISSSTQTVSATAGIFAINSVGSRHARDKKSFFISQMLFYCCLSGVQFIGFIGVWFVGLGGCRLGRCVWALFLCGGDVHLSAAGESVCLLIRGGGLYIGSERELVVLQRHRRIGIRERQDQVFECLLLGRGIDEESAVGETGDGGVSFRHHP